MFIRILAKEDRKYVAGILIDNGYTVTQGKKRRLNADGKPTKVDDYGLEITDTKGANGNES